MTKPTYFTTIQIVTEKITSTGSVEPYRQTSFSFGCKETKVRRDANIWHNFLVKFIETLQRVAEKSPI